MADRFTLPASVIEDARAHPEKYRPEVEAGDRVLIFGPGVDPGTAGRVIYYGTSDGGDHGRKFVNVEASDGNRRMGTGWLRVGGVEQGPRPEVGGRVLALWHKRDGSLTACVGTCESANDEDHPGCITVWGSTPGFPMDHASVVSEWALLPDETESVVAEKPIFDAVRAAIEAKGGCPDCGVVDASPTTEAVMNAIRPLLPAEDDGMGEATAERTVGSLNADDRGKSITTDGIPRGGKLVKIEHRSSKTGESRTLLLVHVGGGSTTVDTPSDTPCKVSDGPGEAT